MPDREHTIEVGLEARPTGKLMHLLPQHNSTSELATELLFPTAVAVPMNEQFALVLEPLAYRVTKVSLEPKTLGVKSNFLANLPAFPCAVGSSVCVEQVEVVCTAGDYFGSVPREPRLLDCAMR